MEIGKGTSNGRNRTSGRRKRLREEKESEEKSD